MAFELSHENLCDRLADACTKNNLVVLLVDAASLKSREVLKLMTQYDRVNLERRFAAVSTIVLWKENRSEEMEEIVRAAFPFFSSRQPPHYHSEIENVEALSKAIDGCLAALQAEVISRPNRAQPLDHPGPPIVTGPGQN